MKRKFEEQNENCDISCDVKELTSCFRKLLSGENNDERFVSLRPTVSYLFVRERSSNPRGY